MRKATDQVFDEAEREVTQRFDRLERDNQEQGEAYKSGLLPLIELDIDQPTKLLNAQVVRLMSAIVQRSQKSKELLMAN